MKMKHLALVALFGTTMLATGVVATGVQAQSAPAPMVLAEDDQLDMQTRDDLRTTLLSTGGEIREVANRMVATRNALIQCITNISNAEGQISDTQEETRCYIDEFVSSRTNLSSVGNILLDAEEKLRMAAKSYGEHSVEVHEMKAAYATETAKLVGQLNEALDHGAKFHAHRAAGKEVTPQMRESALKAAYLSKRLESRLATNSRITASLEAEVGLFRAVERNLGNAADGLAGHSLSFFTQAEILKDQIEEVTINQRLRTADFLASAARSDWSGLQNTLGDLNTAMAQLQADRGKFTFDIPDTSQADEPWAASQKDAVLNAFLARFDEPKLAEADK